ncbi:hypothetical protein J6S88_00280 [bacterium]|nr:hypothetical protein [bacterium]
MRVYSVANNLCQHKQNFGAVLVKDNVLITEKYTGKPTRTAIIELETEERELTADLRMKHKNDIPAEDFQKRVDNIYRNAEENVRNRRALQEWANYLDLFHEETEQDILKEQQTQQLENKYLESIHPTRTKENNISTVSILDELVYKSGDEIYLDDYEFIDRLTRTKNSDIIDINKRVQARKNLEREHVTWMSRYLDELTGGKRKVMPKGGYGLLDRRYGDYLTYSEHSPFDSFFYAEGAEGTGTLRQRILMAIEPQADYRHINPYAKVHAVAEIYTDRASDVVEDMTYEGRKQMAEIIKADKEYEDFCQKILKDKKTDKAHQEQLRNMAYDICERFGISYVDFMYIENGKKYIKTGKEIYNMKLAEMGITERQILPVIVNKLVSLNKNVEGAKNALMETIKEKGLFRGVVIRDIYRFVEVVSKNQHFIYK